MAKKCDFRPFQNESDCIQIGDDLTIENRLDRVSIFGSLDITCDKKGLKQAKELMTILVASVTAMEVMNLPDEIPISPPDVVKNPFD